MPVTFDSLVQIDAKPVAAKRSRKQDLRGCDHCSLNKVKGVKKIMGHVRGKQLLIVAQSPGPEENEAGVELIGRSGQFLWDELEKVGILRKHADIQNVVRCFPATRTEGTYESYLKMRNPSALEIKCCSIHTEKAMESVKARHILVLGQVAHKAFLKTRSVPKQKIFYSKELGAKVYLADHPAFFIRGYGAGERLATFRGTLKQLAGALKDKEVVIDNVYSFLHKQKYVLVDTQAKAIEASKSIRNYAASRRIAIDIEYDDELENRQVFAVGACPKPGLTYVFMTGHPTQNPRTADKIWDVMVDLLEDGDIRKVMHYGCSDVMALEQKAGIRTRGFDWDTNYSDYLWYPDAKAYGLSAIAERRFQAFSGYKQIIVADLMAGLPEDVKIPTIIANARDDQKLNWLAKKAKQYHLSRCSPETIRLYNGADCDLTKRIELDTKKDVPHPLVKLYMDLSFVLKRMEANGPIFDYIQHAKVDKLYPLLIDEKLKKLRKLTDNEDFNPDSHPQVFDAVYNYFGLEYPMSKGKPNTQKKTMLMLSREHPFPGEVVEYRKLTKAKGTYIDGQFECAEQWGGRLRTTFWATGTRTGRLSSSGGDEGGVNLQNLHGDPQLQNMLVADKRWRKVYKVAARLARKYDCTADDMPHKDERGKMIPATPTGRYVCRRLMRWVERNMPDLKTYLILDYGQVEVRVAAQMSGDENLLKDCLSSDIHTLVGVAMTGWSADKIRNDKKTRTLTKNVHFGILFGISKQNLYEFIKAMDPTYEGTPEEVERAYDRYFKRYPGIGDFIASQRAYAEEHGCVYTMFGLRQPLNIDKRRDDGDDYSQYETYEDLKTGNVSWKNQAINGPVQGTAHQLMEAALINLHRKPNRYKVLGVPCMEVHDAIYMMVNVLELQAAYKKARYLLEKESLATVKRDFPDMEWTVPIVTEAEACMRLGDKVPLDEEGFDSESYLMRWFFKAKKQNIALNTRLRKAETRAAA